MRAPPETRNASLWRRAGASGAYQSGGMRANFTTLRAIEKHGCELGGKKLTLVIVDPTGKPGRKTVCQVRTVVHRRGAGWSIPELLLPAAVLP